MVTNSSPSCHWRFIQSLILGSRGISRDAHKLAQTSKVINFFFVKIMDVP